MKNSRKVNIGLTFIYCNPLKMLLVVIVTADAVSIGMLIFRTYDAVTRETAENLVGHSMMKIA